MKKRILMIAALCGAALLSACGGGDGGETFAVASSDLTVAADKTTGPAMAQAISGETFNFSSVPDFGTLTTTSVVVTAATASPTFNISSAAGTASGPLDFGSCIFRITSSTYPATSPLAAGNTITIPTCQLTVRTRLLVADGTARDRSANLRLNSAVSADTLVVVTINEGGQVTINGKPAGTLTLQLVTGG
jgi:hypothetical protein